MFPWAVLLFLASLVGPQVVRAEESLWVVYLEHPPFSFTAEDGQPAGVLVDRAKHIFAHAGIASQWFSMPANRVSEMFRQQDRLWCSIGWYDSPERRQWAQYSLPIYRDAPLVVLTTPRWAGHIRQLGSVDALLGDTSLVWIRLPNATYGAEIEDKARRLRPAIITSPTSFKDAVQMLAHGRGQYLFVAPDGLDHRLTIAGVDPSAMETISLPDMPPGNLRYLILSPNVPPTLIERLNTAIRTLFPPTP